MNMKPVARPQTQHAVLGKRVVYGLLSQYYAAIVVNCFTLNKTI
ncbi:acid stress response protein YqgB [Trabulsiella guamensis]